MDRSKLRMEHEMGYHVRGADHPRAKLTKEDVVDIINCHCQGYSTASVARALGISATQVRSILIGESWGWFTGIRVDRPVLQHPENARELFYGPHAPLAAYKNRGAAEAGGPND